jgi:hypothetical protein
MDARRAEELGQAIVSFLETGNVPDGLFAPDVFLDLTTPLWRVQARGVEDLVRIRKDGHPGKGVVPRWRCDPTPTGFVLEFEERWEDGGQQWYCRELIRAEVAAGSVQDLSVYCTGDWDEARQREHRRSVTLLRP